MVRLFYALICVLLLAWAAYGQAPKYTVESKMPKYTVTNTLTTTSGVVVNAPFPAQPTTQVITARSAGSRSQKSMGTAPSPAATYILAPTDIPGGITTQKCIGFV